MIKLLLNKMKCKKGVSKELVAGTILLTMTLIVIVVILVPTSQKDRDVLQLVRNKHVDFNKRIELK